MLHKPSENTEDKHILQHLKTSLLRRLQAQTLPDATPPLGKILLFTKITVTFEPMKQFSCPSRFIMTEI